MPFKHQHFESHLQPVCYNFTALMRNKRLNYDFPLCFYLPDFKSLVGASFTASQNFSLVLLDKDPRNIYQRLCLNRSSFHFDNSY